MARNKRKSTKLVPPKPVRPPKKSRWTKVRGDVSSPLDRPADLRDIRREFQSYPHLRPMPEAREEPFFDSRFLPADELTPHDDFSLWDFGNLPRPLTSPRDTFDGRRIPGPPREPAPRIPTEADGRLTPAMSEHILRQTYGPRPPELDVRSASAMSGSGVEPLMHTSPLEALFGDSTMTGDLMPDASAEAPLDMDQLFAAAEPMSPLDPLGLAAVDMPDEFALASQQFDEPMQLASQAFEQPEDPLMSMPDLGGFEQPMLELPTPPTPPSLPDPFGSDPFGGPGPIGW